jgi:hypothetical protein
LHIDTKFAFATGGGGTLGKPALQRAFDVTRIFKLDVIPRTRKCVRSCSTATFDCARQ